MKIFKYILILLGIFLLYSYWIIKMPVKVEEDIHLKIELGESLDNILNDLDNNNLLRNKVYFKYYLKYYDLVDDLKAGDYYFKTGEKYNFADLVNKLKEGKLLKEQKVLQIKEGQTIYEIKEKLAKLNYDLSNWNEIIKVKHWQDKFTFLNNIDPDKSLEGFLFPDTYSFDSDDNLENIIYTILKHFGEKTADLRLEIAKRNDYPLYDYLILASVVEWEVRTDKNRALVADIFWRRYKDQYLLQSDATLNYGKSRAEHEDRHNIDELLKDSPYNTYKNIGLPPSPVNNPGLSALKAVVYPEKNDFYYFLTTENGEIYYAKTYKEHLENIHKYLE